MRKPNFIFILVDDLGWGDLGCYGSIFYETEYLDQIATEGVKFTDAYAAAPICSPTRASILTGKYPATLGLTNFIGGKTKGKLIDAPYIDHLSLGEKSLAEALKQGGYSTWHVGKWHLGGEPYYPEHHGFDVNIGGCSWGLPSQGYFSPWGINNLKDGYEGQFLTDRLTEEAIRLIKNRSDNPFYLNLCYYAVHVPIQAKTALVNKYQKKVKDLKLDKVKTFKMGEHFPCEHKRYQRVLRRLVQSDAVYAGLVEIVDQNVGKLLQAVEEEGLKKDTIIIFTSDNGGLSTAEGSPTCNAPLSEGKGWMKEGGIREPLLIRWPGVIRSGSICNVPVTSVDFYPTILEIAGLPPIRNQHTDGLSIFPLLKGNDKMERKAIFWHYPHYSNQGNTPGSSIRIGDYKLIEFFEDNSIELYNLKDDITEQNNLAYQEEDKSTYLLDTLKNWQLHVKARIPESNLEYSGW